MHKVVEARTESDYRVWLKFADGASGTVDLSSLAGKGVFKAWEDKAFFASVFIDEQTHALAWAGGIDLCPGNLYATVTGTEILNLFNKKKSGVG